MSSLGKLVGRGLAVAGIGAAGVVGYGVYSPVYANDEVLHPPAYAWEHIGPFQKFDARAIRRGYEVYKNVCSSCHSMKFLHYRNLVGVAFTEDEAKILAADTEVEDGPNDEGEMFTRPGRLSDKFPDPYANEEAARYANNGALPPDLSCVVKAREAKEDYIFALLTGYRDPPDGVVVREGLHYNPYFTGGGIAMARALYDGGVDYDDGTPATTSQMAKDVSVFLTWASNPEHDVKKQWGSHMLMTLAVFTPFIIWFKRFRFSPYKYKRLVFRDQW
ncbi:hypothetical protein NDN08_005633 [Rhodosorus marinus]|uniref:Cytochrome c domain-containing protein n=1 Tax=Rhodosorus marinus TaxID=101924 RepID=A0AAV8V4M0_9RHOD|nr:hypothetical protein NDN08_005633 [Rhodosorus marinus]